MIVFTALFLFPFLITSNSKENDDSENNNYLNILADSIPPSSDESPSISESQSPPTQPPTPTSTPIPFPSPTPDLSKVPSLGAIIGTCIASLIIMTATTSYFCFKKTSTEPDQEPSFSTAAQILLDKKYEPV